MSVKFCFEIPSDCWENCKKILRGYFFAAPCRFSHRPCIRLSNAESRVSTLNSDNSSNIAYSWHVSTECFCALMSENFMWGRGPHIFTEQGPIGFKSGPDPTRAMHPASVVYTLIKNDTLMHHQVVPLLIGAYGQESCIYGARHVHTSAGIYWLSQPGLGRAVNDLAK